MITVIPRRYDAPKWQAAVPADKVFVCQNGDRLASLFDLKQALTNLPEETLASHLQDNRHDFADWINGAVGDPVLSEALRDQRHRWGMLVTLERHMMRSLNLPSYVASRWLRTVPHPFTFNSAASAQSLTQLHERLNELSDNDLEPHLSRLPNDIAKWVNDEVGDYPLAEILAEANNRLQMAAVLEDHLIMLKEASLS